jgi:hypothetical protein
MKDLYPVTYVVCGGVLWEEMVVASGGDGDDSIDVVGVVVGDWCCQG